MPHRTCVSCGKGEQVGGGQDLLVCADCLDDGRPLPWLSEDGYERQERCPVCDKVCISCAMRAPEFDTYFGPMCGQCIGNGQAEPYTEESTDHEHPEEDCEMGAFWGGGIPSREPASRELRGLE